MVTRHVSLGTPVLCRLPTGPRETTEVPQQPLQACEHPAAPEAPSPSRGPRCWCQPWLRPLVTLWLLPTPTRIPDYPTHQPQHKRHGGGQGRQGDGHTGSCVRRGEGEARDDGGARHEIEKSRTSTKHSLGSMQKGPRTLGRFETSTLPAPSRSNVDGSASRQGVRARRLSLTAANRGLACPTAGLLDQVTLDATLLPGYPKQAPRIHHAPNLPVLFVQLRGETTPAKFDLPQMDVSSGSCGGCPPNCPRTRH